jgi:MFS family permease
MTFAVICCIIGSFMMAVTESYTVLAVGRFLQGFGSAFGFVGALKLATIWLPSERFAFFSGMCCMGGFFGAAIGQIGLNYLVEQFGFTVMGLFITVAFIMFLGLQPKKSATDVVHPPVTFKQMMKQFGQIMKKPNLWVAGLLSCFIFFPTDVFAALWGRAYILAIHPDFTISQASTASAMIFIGWGIGSPLMGYISDRMNRRMPLLVLGALGSTVLATVALYYDALNFYQLCAVYVAFGIFSSAQILTFAVAVDLCPPNLAGTALAFVNTFSMIPGLIFQSGMGYLLDLSRDGRVDATGNLLYVADDYRQAFMIIPVLLGLAFLLCFVGLKGETKLVRKHSK